MLEGLSIHCRSNWLDHLGPEIWIQVVPSDVKKLEVVKAFKFAIKMWLPDISPADSANGMATTLTLYDFLKI